MLEQEHEAFQSSEWNWITRSTVSLFFPDVVRSKCLLINNARNTHRVSSPLSSKQSRYSNDDDGNVSSDSRSGDRGRAFAPIRHVHLPSRPRDLSIHWIRIRGATSSQYTSGVCWLERMQRNTAHLHGVSSQHCCARVAPTLRWKHRKFHRIHDSISVAVR